MSMVSFVLQSESINLHFQILGLTLGLIDSYVWWFFGCHDDFGGLGGYFFKNFIFLLQSTTPLHIVY